MNLPKQDPKHIKTQTGLPKVQYATLFPGNDCNLRCDYCFIHTYGEELKSQKMSKKTARQVLRFMITHTDPGEMINIHFFGGEPLLYFDVMKYFVAEAKKMNKLTNRRFYWGVTTNCTLITDEVNRFLRDNNFYVLTSIDGWEEAHDVHRKYKDGRGSFDDARIGLMRLMGWYKPVIRWTVTPENLDKIFEYCQLYISFGCPAVAYEAAYEVEWKEKDYKEYERQLRLVADFFIERAREGAIVDFKPLRDGLELYGLRDRFTKGSTRCGLCPTSLGFGADGSIWRCQRFLAGQYKMAKLGNIWEGIDIEHANKINEDWDPDKVVPPKGMDCSTCEAKVICNGGCLAANYDMHGDVYRVNEVWCRLTRIKIREAMRVYGILVGEGNMAFKGFMDRGRGLGK